MLLSPPPRLKKLPRSLKKLPCSLKNLPRFWKNFPRFWENLPRFWKNFPRFSETVRRFYALCLPWLVKFRYLCMLERCVLAREKSQLALIPCNVLCE